MRLAVDFGGPLVGLGIEKSMHMVKEAGFDGIDYNIRDYHLGDDFREIAQNFKAMMDFVRDGQHIFAHSFSKKAVDAKIRVTDYKVKC